jgi:hypothetical protein
MINLSYIKLKGKVIDNYTSTLKGWHNKMVNWEDMHKPMSDSSIQYSCYSWRNGCKTGINFDRSKQNCLCLDVDNGMSIQKFQKMFSKYTYILGTTKNHMKDKKGLIVDRFRVVIKAINIPDDDLVYFRTLELLAPFNDAQTLTKTASFLGNDNAVIIRNDGKSLDLHKIGLVASQQIEQEKLEREAKKIDRMLFSNYNNSSLDVVKEQITKDITIEILESIGIDVIGNKCKLRDSERTHSTKIYNDGGLYDFGSGDSYDIFKVLMELEGMTFPESIQYVKNFI